MNANRIRVSVLQILWRTENDRCRLYVPDDCRGRLQHVYAGFGLLHVQCALARLTILALARGLLVQPIDPSRHTRQADIERDRSIANINKVDSHIVAGFQTLKAVTGNR